MPRNRRSGNPHTPMKSLINHRNCARPSYAVVSAMRYVAGHWATCRYGSIARHIILPMMRSRRLCSTLKCCITFPISTRLASVKVRSWLFASSMCARFGSQTGSPVIVTTGESLVRTCATGWNCVIPRRNSSS